MPVSGPAPRPDAGLLVLRLGLGTLLLFHGVYKVTHGVAWIAGPLSGAGLPAWLQYGAYIGEVLAPMLVILGLWARPAALAIAIDMSMAIFLARRGDVSKVNPMSGGWAIELELLYLIAALAIVLAGSGRYRLGRG